MALQILKSKVTGEEIELSSLNFFPRNPIADLAEGDYSGVTTGLFDLAKFDRVENGETKMYNMLFAWVVINGKKSTIKIPCVSTPAKGTIVSFSVVMNAKSGYKEVRDFKAKTPVPNPVYQGEVTQPAVSEYI